MPEGNRRKRVRAATVQGEGITLTPEKEAELHKLMMENIERNPAMASTMLRMARACGISSVQREYNRLTKFAARKVRG